MRTLHRFPCLILLLAAGLAALPTTLSAAALCSSAGVSGNPSPDPSPGPAPDVPPTPNQSAIDSSIDNFVATGSLATGPLANAYPADQAGGGGGLSSDDASAVVEYVYRNRLVDSNDTIQALMARDSEVSQAYQTLLSTGQLTSSADSDPAAAFHHLSLLRNAGSTGGFTISGNQVTSNGVQPFPPLLTCRVNPGGFITWPYGRPWDQCSPNHYQQAVVYLTVHQSNGLIYRAFTTSYTCGSNTSYGFRNVPPGSANVLARPVRQCCQEGQTNFQITCPPGPAIMLPCIPAGTNQLVNIAMGPWSPPGFWGATAPGAQVWIANKDDACLVSASTPADAQGNFLITGCLPSGDVYLYAQSGSQIGRVDVPDTLPCGEILGPFNIVVRPPPTVSGHILNWIPAWYPNAGAMGEGCFTVGCNAGASMQITAPASQTTGSYQLTLKPGHWNLYSYHDLGNGYCTNASGQTVRWRCLTYYGALDLEVDQHPTIDLPLPPAYCPCPG